MHLGRTNCRSILQFQKTIWNHLTLSFNGWQGFTLSANEEYLDQVAEQIHLLDSITTIALPERSEIEVQQRLDEHLEEEVKRKDPDGAATEIL